jgi:predicted transcriptional regulator
MKKKDDESSEDLKNLLGYMGIEILLAINKGARDLETIKIFSGTPLECIKGRLPVLLGLNLVKKEKEEYFLTKKGIRFGELLKA